MRLYESVLMWGSLQACRSCRRRKVRCDRDGRVICRACERRSSPCITGSPPLGSPILPGLDGSGPELGSDSTQPLIGLPALEETEPQLPVLSCCDLVFDQATNASDPFSTLFCLSLPRSVVGQCGTWLSTLFQLRSDCC